MTISGAIDNVDRLKPNGFSDDEKIGWLSELDARIWAEIIQTHEGAEDRTWEPYTEDTDRDTVLLAYAPYDPVYRYWLEAQIDLYNMELDKYNNSTALFNAAYQDFAGAYNRTHMPHAPRAPYFHI